MKLRQIEYCHGCNKQVEFVFEDVTGNQVILCPVCGHRHYRQIDEGTLTQIRMDGMRPGMRVAICPELPVSFRPNDELSNDIIEPIFKEVIAVKDGRAVIEGKGVKVVTERRWGRDPRQ